MLWEGVRAGVSRPLSPLAEGLEPVAPGSRTLRLGLRGPPSDAPPPEQGRGGARVTRPSRVPAVRGGEAPIGSSPGLEPRPGPPFEAEAGRGQRGAEEPQCP